MFNEDVQHACGRRIFLDRTSGCLCTIDPQTGKAVWIIDQTTGKPMKNKRLYLDKKSGCYCAVDFETGVASLIIDPVTGKPMSRTSGVQGIEGSHAPANAAIDLNASTNQDHRRAELQPSQQEGIPASTAMAQSSVDPPGSWGRLQPVTQHGGEMGQEKICDFCGATVGGDILTCPHCASIKFRTKCLRCGNAYDGSTCPACSETDRAAAEEAEAVRTMAEAERKANDGLAWKTTLTVLLPFVGGYFLINENVKKGFRIFGIVWCALSAMMMGIVPGYDAWVRMLSSLLCLAPIAVYLFKGRGKLFKGGDLKSKASVAAFCAVFAIAMVGNVAGAAANPALRTSEYPSAKTENADELGSSSSSAGVLPASTIDAKISATTNVLEYSNKDVDPTTLVKCDGASAKVTTDDRIDLMKVGLQTVTYKVAVGNESASQTIDFTVRDTKAPTIVLSNSNPSIDQGSGYDSASSISSVSDAVDGPLARVDAEPEARGSNVGNEVFYDAGWYTVDGAVDSDVPGTYSLIVRATDRHGNVAVKEILVTVNEVVQETEVPAPTPATYAYIANTNTHKFHLPGCRDVAKMNESNKLEVTATRQEMIDMGYSPCKHCNP